MIGRFFLKLLFASKLNPVQVFHVEPESRYLAVVNLPERLSQETTQRLQAQYKYFLDHFFGENRCGLIIIEGDATLNFFQFCKEKSDA